MNSSLRKDSKKDFCFEISATDKRSYMVGWCFHTLVPLPLLSAAERLNNRFFYANGFCIIWLSQLLGGNVRHNPRFSLWLQFCASSVKEAEEWVKQIDFVLKGSNTSYHNQTFLQQNSSSQKKKKIRLLCVQIWQASFLKKRRRGRNCTTMWGRWTRSTKCSQVWSDGYCPTDLEDILLISFKLDSRSLLTLTSWCLPLFHQRRTCQALLPKWSQWANLLLLFLLQVAVRTM